MSKSTDSAKARLQVALSIHQHKLRQHSMQGSRLFAATTWQVKVQPCVHAKPNRRQLRLACRAADRGNSASAVADKLGNLFSKVGKKAEEEEDRCARKLRLVTIPGWLWAGWCCLYCFLWVHRFKYDFANSRWVRVKPERDADGGLQSNYKQRV